MGNLDHLFKVLVVGDAQVGKTSLLHRYVYDVFCKEYKMTIGVDFALKIVQWSDSVTVRLQLWDIAGQERFTSMTRLYYKQASACVVMFDLTNIDSFRSSRMWKEDLDSKVTQDNGDPVPCILLANKGHTPRMSFIALVVHRCLGTTCKLSRNRKKVVIVNIKHSYMQMACYFVYKNLENIYQCDLSPWAVTKEEVDQFSKENNFIGWTETSVKENKNINESMRVLIEKIMETRDRGYSSLVTQGNYINLKDLSVPGSSCC
ncbi:ras-related protein Rab-7L1 isoform X1 [Bombina bombina]|uniref:ras-related protein Rab-7L1 isoform X1 n=1 Tax=Bombina bombina TaxID=8345 RepID=UPI00235A97CD|nr:ras-related protein Rab-7L1 isoform X1 [Bombina bombina]